MLLTNRFVLVSCFLCFAAPSVAAELPGVLPDPENTLFSIKFIDGKPSDFSREKIDPLISVDHSIPPAKISGDTVSPHEKIHPTLKALAARHSGDESVGVVISFQEDVKLPRLPSLNPGLARDSVENIAILAQTRSQVEKIKTKRASRQLAKIDSIQRDHGGVVTSRFWITNAVAAEIPLAALSRLAARPDVLSIDPQKVDAPPPYNSVADGRARIGSDPYFNQNPTQGGSFGLIDTGVRTNHMLLSNPSPIGANLNCLPSSDVPCEDEVIFTDPCNHGTSTAAILAGNSSMSNAFRGVVPTSTVNSYNVFVSSIPCYFFVSTAIQGFETAVFNGDDVIVAGIQANQSSNSALSMAADAAFDTNRLVIAAAGNYGPTSGSVKSPGNAHKAIAVGAVDVITNVLEPYSGRGPTTDGRTKPDLAAPTNTLTARSASDTDMGVFDGTSGATPYAAGAAMVLKNWFQQYGVYDAGHVYASLIAFGTNSALNNAYDDDLGAGRLLLPVNYNLYWGSTSVSHGQNVDINVFVATDRKMLDVAIWWPETAVQQHNNVDLYLIGPGGSVVASSTGVNGVFEKVNYDNGAFVPGGTYKLRVKGSNIPAGSQSVYFAFAQRQ